MEEARGESQGVSDLKQVIVARTDLNMRKGKLAAQVAHASMKVFLDRAQPIKKNEFPEMPEAYLAIELDERTEPWLLGSHAKIVVGVDSEVELLAIHEKAKAAGLLTALVQDAGKTEFHGVPTYTTVAIGPDTAEKIDTITGQLKLL